MWTPRLLLVSSLTLVACGSAPVTSDDGGAPADLTGADGGGVAQDLTGVSVADMSGKPADLAVVPSDGGTSSTGQWVLGYYVGYAVNQLPIAQIDWSGLTHIAMAPLLVKSDRTLDYDFFDSNGTGQQDAMALSAAAHAHNVKALLMLGGAGAGGNIAVAASPQHRAQFVTTLLAGMDQLGYDGIDLDWEDSVNVDDLVALAAALRAARPGILLSYPAGCINGNFQTVDPRMATLAQSLDRFMVQTYYPSTAFAGSGWSSWFTSPVSGVSGATPIAIDDTLQRYHAAGIPNAKLGMGIGFYAICYTGGITGPRQPTNGGTQRITGGDNDYPLSLFFAANRTFDKSTMAERRIDATAQSPYLSLASPVNDSACGGNTQYISYDDETSIIAKGTWSKSKGYGGIIIWQLAEGYLPQNASGGRARNSLMQALRTGFLQ